MSFPITPTTKMMIRTLKWLKSRLQQNGRVGHPQRQRPRAAGEPLHPNLPLPASALAEAFQDSSAAQRNRARSQHMRRTTGHDLHPHQNGVRRAYHRGIIVQYPPARGYDSKLHSKSTSQRLLRNGLNRLCDSLIFIVTQKREGC